MKNVLDDKNQTTEESDLLDLLGLGQCSNSIASPTKRHFTPTSVTNTQINSSNFTCDDSHNNIDGERYDTERNINDLNSFTNRKRGRSLNRSNEIYDINAISDDDERKNLDYALALSLLDYEKPSEDN
jgi:hypothetical protein